MPMIRLKSKLSLQAIFNLHLILLPFLLYCESPRLQVDKNKQKSIARLGLNIHGTVTYFFFSTENKTFDWPNFRLSLHIQQILFHIANHFTHHRGQIISDLRQNGIEPRISDYIFYKRSERIQLVNY